MEKDRDEWENYINLLDILKYLLKYYKLIILTTIIGVVLGVVLSVVSYLRGEMSKQYLIKTSIAVTSQNEDGLFTTRSDNPDSTDIHLAEDMVDSVIFVIRSDRTLEKAVDELKLIGISAKDIYSNLKLSQYNSTQIIDISLYWRNAEEGIKILESINKVCPAILKDVLKIGDVSVVNVPKSKYLIGGSLKISTLIKMVFLGFAAGIGICGFIMLFFPTIINATDVEGKLNIKLLGTVPKEKTKKKSAAQNEHDRAYTDNIISTAHVLMNKLKKNGEKIVFVTSAAEHEGKTEITTNLGRTFAELEKKVLLVDMDLASPNLGSMFMEDIDYEHTLNAVYAGDEEIDDVIIEVDGYLSILPLIHDKKEILFNENMLAIIKEKAKEYDYVFIDTSSIGDSADILSLNQLADSALFVVQYDKQLLSTIRKSLERLNNTDIPVVGCVLNQTTILS